MRLGNETLDAAHVTRHDGATAGPHVVITVADTGTGMDADTLEHLFEPFFTTKPYGTGTGLGLSIVYGIVRDAGGHIEVESASGRGSTFRLYVPPRAAGSNRPPSPASHGLAATRPSCSARTRLRSEDCSAPS